MSEQTKKMLAFIGGILIGVIFCATLARAHDDGRFADSPLHDWFNGLASHKGLCCSFADGVTIKDVDWDTLGSRNNGGSGYRVRIDGQWIEVPESALVVEPNKYHRAVVWPYQDVTGAVQIRCFMAGAGT